MGVRKFFTEVEKTLGEGWKVDGRTSTNHLRIVHSSGVTIFFLSTPGDFRAVRKLPSKAKAALRLASERNMNEGTK
jgi:hypothetical protein